MKKLFFIIIFMLILCIKSNAEVNVEPKKFEVKFTITYNNLTLKEAAELEKAIRESNINADNINVELDKASCSNNCYFMTSDNLVVGSENYTLN